MIDRQALISQLRSQILTVTFTKKNGETRRMTCTLQPEYFSSDKYNNVLTENTDRSNCTVWDINAQGWRSFLWDNITLIQSGDTQ